MGQAIDLATKILWDIVTYISLHPLHVKLLTAVVSTICALFIGMLRKKTVLAESWAWYFQWAFIVYAISYLSQCAIGYLEAHHWLPAAWEHVRNFIGTAASGANNLFFLATARTLLKKQPPIPKWACWVAPFAIVEIFSYLGGWTAFAVRLPDGLFSIYCLSWIGYATGNSISLHRGNSRILSRAAVAVALLYTFAQIFYVFVPLLAEDYLPFITKALEPLFANSGKSRLSLLDALAMAAVLPLKFGLFVPGFIALQRSIIVVSSETARNMLAKIISGQREDLIGEEMLKSIGEEVDADKVELVLRMPGRCNERVTCFKWDRQTKKLESGAETALPSADSDVGRVLRTGREALSLNAFENTFGASIRLGWLTREKSSVAVPVPFHGAVIGCLRLEMSERPALSHTAIQHIRELAALTSYAVQSYRELAAANQFSDRFAAWRVRQKEVNLEKGVQEVAEILYDILSPLVVSVSVDVGFRYFEKRVGLETYTKSTPAATNGYRTEAPAGILARLESQGAGAQTAGLQPMVLTTELGVRQSDSQRPLLEVGRLVLVVPSDRDDLVQPTLGTHQLHRQTIGALLNEAILGIARDHLNLALKDLGVRLNNNHSLDFLSWFREVDKTARQTGALWAVVADPESNRLFGDEEPVAYISKHRGDLKPGETGVDSFPLSPPVAGASSLIVVQLPVMETQIWLGVSHKGFGPELDSPTPWRVFIDRFAEIADSALVRITSIAELQRLQMEAAQAQGIAMMAVTIGTLAHQLTNLVRNIASPINTLNEALLVGRLQADGDLKEMIGSMQQPADQLLKLLSETMLAGKIDDRRPCSLLEAAGQSKQLFDIALTRSGIALEVQVADDLVIDAPFHVVSLAIANLVSNAIEAMKKRDGRIRIEAEDVGEMIHCYVTDNGPGVHPSVRDRLFKLGITTRRGGGGWGLYLVQRSLIENGGRIELSQSGPGETKFTIQFPKSA